MEFPCAWRPAQSSGENSALFDTLCTVPRFLTTGVVVAAVVLLVFGFCVFKILSYNASATRGTDEVRRAYALVETGHFAEAQALYDAALQEILDDRQRAYALGNRGWARANLGRDPEAIRDFSAALQIFPDLEFCLIDRGLAYHRQRNFPAALADYKHALALDHNAVDAYQNRALIYAHRGQWPEAIADMMEAIRCSPDNPRWFLRLGAIFFWQGDLEAARARLDSAIRLAPEYAEAYWMRAKVWTQLNHPERGLADVEAALQQRPKSAPLYLARGIILLDAFRPDLALGDLDTALQLAPGFPMALAGRGLAQFQLGNYDAAYADAAKAARLAPKSPHGYYVMGSTRDVQEIEREAIEDFEKSITRDSEFAQPVAWRGLAEAHAGEYDKARRDLEAVVQEFPGNDETHRVRAIFLASCPDGRFRDGPVALAEARRAVDISHRNPAALDTLAMAYAEVGDFNQAIALEAAALEKIPERARARAFMEQRLHSFEQHRPYRDVR